MNNRENKFVPGIYTNEIGFQKELEELIKKHSMEVDSNTPDYILAEYLTNCLINYNNIIQSKNEYNNEQ